MHTSERREQFIVPIGPQHPALKEPGHFEFTVDGETVTAASARLGYAHRGLEKACEQRSWVQNLYMFERTCGICSHIHATAYSIGVEKLAGVEIPPRAQAIRVLIAEMERVHSHLLWLGVTAHEAGFDTLFMYTWRDRETIMDLLEAITGNRVNYSANVLGGVKFDITSAQEDEIRRGLVFLEKRTRHYLNVVRTDEFFLRRTRDVGITSNEHAQVLGIVGPTARASGVARDVRVDSPYAAYDIYPIEMVLETSGDLAARTAVRVKELFECYRVVLHILDHMPEGEIQTKMPRRIKEGEVISRVEAPRGELWYYIKSNGTDKPERVHYRTPTIPNMASVLALAVGHQLADIPMILAGIDPCFSCQDRTITVHRGRNQDHWTWEDLRRYGIETYRKRGRS